MSNIVSYTYLRATISHTEKFSDTIQKIQMSVKAIKKFTKSFLIAVLYILKCTHYLHFNKYVVKFIIL